MKRFRGGLVFKAHRLCVSLNSRVESNKAEEGGLPKDDVGGVVWHGRELDFFIDNLLVRIHFIIEMIRWTGLVPKDDVGGGVGDARARAG